MSNIQNLPLRFRDDGNGRCEHLMPCECRKGCDANGLFRCIGGEVVKVHWCGVYRNERGESEEQLEHLAQRLYEWSFPRVNSSWIARLGKVEGWYDWIRLEKCEK